MGPDLLATIISQDHLKIMEATYPGITQLDKLYEQAKLYRVDTDRTALDRFNSHFRSISSNYVKGEQLHARLVQSHAAILDTASESGDYCGQPNFVGLRILLNQVDLTTRCNSLLYANPTSKSKLEDQLIESGYGPYLDAYVMPWMKIPVATTDDGKSRNAASVMDELLERYDQRVRTSTEISHEEYCLGIEAMCKIISYETRSAQAEHPELNLFTRIFMDTIAHSLTEQNTFILKCRGFESIRVSRLFAMQLDTLWTNTLKILTNQPESNAEGDTQELRLQLARKLMTNLQVADPMFIVYMTRGIKARERDSESQLQGYATELLQNNSELEDVAIQIMHHYNEMPIGRITTTSRLNQIADEYLGEQTDTEASTSIIHQVGEILDMHDWWINYMDEIRKGKSVRWHDRISMKSYLYNDGPERIWNVRVFLNPDEFIGFILLDNGTEINFVFDNVDKGVTMTSQTAKMLLGRISNCLQQKFRGELAQQDSETTQDYPVESPLNIARSDKQPKRKSQTVMQTNGQAAATPTTTSTQTDYSWGPFGDYQLGVIQRNSRLDDGQWRALVYHLSKKLPEITDKDIVRRAVENGIANLYRVKLNLNGRYVRAFVLKEEDGNRVVYRLISIMNRNDGDKEYYNREIDKALGIISEYEQRD